MYIAALGEMTVVGVYVDDIVVACKSDERLKQIKSCLCRRFSVNVLGKLHHFLGIRVIQDDVIWIGQPVNVDTLLNKLRMQDAKSVSTPVDTSIKLTKAVDGEELFDQDIYQSAVGCLLYLSRSTRPDISFAVSNVAKYSSEPTRKHWRAVKRILRYLKGTATHGLMYTASSPDDLHGYSILTGQATLMTGSPRLGTCFYSVEPL